MAKFRLVQNNWTAGELTPYLYGRPDFNRYQLGAAKLENFIILPHGPIVRRSGTIQVAEKKTVTGNNTNFKLIPFVFSESDVFMLEFGHQYIRFFKNGAVVGAPYELVSPYTATHIRTIDFTQSGNVMYLFHPSVKTRRLVRVADDNWVISEVDYYDGPYHKVQIYDDLTTPETWSMTPSAVGTPGATVTITVKSSVGGVNITPFNANDVGRYIRIYHVTGSPEVVTWGVGKITAVNGASPALNVEVVTPFGDTAESDTWRISIFHGPDRWPAKGTFHEERMVVARNADYINTVWGSVVDDFTNFSPSAVDGTVADDHAYAHTLGTGQIDAINWIRSNKALLIGTVAGPYSMTGNDIRTPIGPKAIQATKESSFGSAEKRPVVMDRTLLYVSQTRKQLVEMYYSLNVEGFETPVASIMAEHMLRPKLTEIYDADEPYHVVWGYTDNGMLISLTYMKDQNVLGFTRCPLGGDGKVRALATIPSDEQTQVWMIVQRTVNGQNKYFIEYMDQLFVPDEFTGITKEDAYFLDCGKKITGPTTTVSVPHLPNTTVDILADGNEILGVTLDSSGETELAVEATHIHVGLRCPAKFRTLPLDIVAPELVTAAMNKSVKKLFIDVMDALGGKVSNEIGTYEVFEYRNAPMPMGSSPPLYSGLLEVPILLGTKRSIDFEIVQESPFPFTIRSIIAEMSIGE